ncbi:MAG: hypothetical protein ISS13_02475 [Actinobacteria bacterium]|nr:hypothetical protein [Actinomycetota bacterium]
MVLFFISLGFYIAIGLIFWRFKILKRKYLEPLFMWIMLCGILALCQPWLLNIYHWSYAILLTGVAGYIFSIHLK